jgi:hypothetical protein
MVKPYDIYEFTDSRQAEVLARCCRVWVDKETLDPHAIILAEAVLKVGGGMGVLVNTEQHAFGPVYNQPV